jgi:hypothetical protein
MANIEYSSSIKKQAIAAIGSFLIICVVGWRFAPINTPEKAAMLSVFIIILTIATLWYIKKRGKLAICSSCSVDLFEVINATDKTKLSFKYCPSCGSKVEI